MHGRLTWTPAEVDDGNRDRIEPALALPLGSMLVTRYVFGLVAGGAIALVFAGAIAGLWLALPLVSHRLRDTP